jgi:hypothetical protein
VELAVVEQAEVDLAQAALDKQEQQAQQILAVVAVELEVVQQIKLVVQVAQE